MAAKKYYAVKAGREPGIYETWAECQKQVIGYKGALFKSFPTKQEADTYLSGEAAVTAPVVAATADSRAELRNGSHYDIYVDGSYDHRKRQYSWGFAAYRDDELIHTASGVGRDESAVAARNVAGELEATMEAVTWAQTQDVAVITIHHDYSGISEWATGSWKTNNALTQGYAAFIGSHLSWVRFHKVAGHTGVAGNELADRLAGEALKNYNPAGGSDNPEQEG